MGALITFPQTRRTLCETPTRMVDDSAAIIILPVIRIERADDAAQVNETETTKSPSDQAS
jgi:hypothetical protein